MKKPNKKMLRHQHQKSVQCMRRRQRINQSLRRKLPRNQRHPKGKIVAPESFVLLASRRHGRRQVNDYFAFLHVLRTTTQGASIVIDMRGVTFMVADATLLFKAELSRLLQCRAPRIEAIAPTSLRIQEVLIQTGIAAMLRLKMEATPSRDDVVHWRVAEGTSDRADPALIGDITEDIERVTGVTPHPIYQGIVESIANCVEHAYQPHPEVTRALPTSPGWWVFQQVKDGELTVIVCDLGIGIHRALPLSLADEPGLLQRLRASLDLALKGRDVRALKAAMEIGRTSTKRRERGRGMRNAHNVIDEVGKGTFFAISNKGFYRYTRTKNTQNAARESLSLRHSINGTMLGWRLPLNGKDTT